MQRLATIVIAAVFVIGCDLPKKKDEGYTTPVEPDPLVPIKVKKKPKEPKCTKKLPKAKALKPAFVLRVLKKLHKVGPTYPSKNFKHVLLAKGASWRIVLDYKDRRYTVFSNVGIKASEKERSKLLFGTDSFVSIWVRWKGRSDVSTFSDGSFIDGHTTKDGLAGVVNYGNYGKRYFSRQDCKGFEHMPYFQFQYRQTIYDLAKILHVSVN